MITKTAFPNCYIQGKGAINRLQYEVKSFGDFGLCIVTKTGWERLNKYNIFENSVPSIKLCYFNGECSKEEIDRLCSEARFYNAEFIIAIGGGKTIDTGKIVASRLDVPVAVVPTIASTDAPTSACAVVYDENGGVLGVEYQKHNPNLVLVDSQIIADAPARFLVAGMGDALATWFEAESCRIKQAKNEVGELGSLTAYSLAKLCYDTIINYGVEAYNDCLNKKVIPALEAVIEANTLLSGLGFESGGLAGAHSIHNGLTSLPQTHGYYHGEKVAFGVLASLFLSETKKKYIEEVYTFCEKVGLPTTLEDLNLKSIKYEELIKVAKRTCQPGEFIHHEGDNITPELVIDLILKADKEGKRRKETK
jgi:glycerol dehydrogenase